MNEDEMNDGDLNDGEANHVEVTIFEVNDCGIVHTEIDDDSEDVSFHYASALGAAFEYLDEGNDDFMEDGIKNILGYANDTKTTCKKHK